MENNLDDLRIFLLVAREGSFTKAATQLGLSRSAISYCISNLEKHLGAKLFHRTTRNISLTQIGELLYKELQPLFSEIDLKLNRLLSDEYNIRGTLRITGTPHALGYTLWNKIVKFIKKYPTITLELVEGIRFVDIVKERFDAGIRASHQIEKDMIAVRVSNPIVMCCAASPNYLKKYSPLKNLSDLKQHHCIYQRLPSKGGLLQWEFDQSEKFLKPAPFMIVNSSELAINASLSDIGIVWQPMDILQEYFLQGKLIEVLPTFNKTYAPYCLYYPNRTIYQPLLRALVQELRE